MGFTNFNDKYSAIPQELKGYKNWVCWQAYPDPKSHSGISKKPVNPKTGGLAQSNNPDTWSDFETAVRQSGKYSGIGFMFSNSPFFGVDLDDMPNDIEDYQNGGADNIISEFVNTLQSYTEFSQSKTGVHIICKGTLPEGRRKAKNDSGGFEMYENGRFFVVTGNYCSEYGYINDCTESVKPLHSKYLGKTAEPKPNRQNITVNLNSVDDIVRAACSAKNGSLFKALYSGDFSAYSSQSEADMAFCNMLAFWCGCDAEKMDAIFRQSGLMRDKWDRKQSGTTYGVITLQKAISGCSQTYNPKKQNDYSISIGNGKVIQTVDEEKMRAYTFDDMGNAERFVDLFGENVRYCYTEKKWYFYNSMRWSVDNLGVILRMADKCVEAMKAEAKLYLQADEESGGDMAKAFEKHMKSSRSNKSKKAMLNEIEHHLPILPIQMDRYKMALNTPSGIINLKNGDVKAHNPEYYFTKITSVDCAEAADCPRWLAFLDDIFAGDKDLIRYIQKAVGYSLTGSTAEQCAFFLYGTGRNGKSTFIDVIRDVFGDYAANIQPETIMVKSSQSNAINSDIARLKGARLVTSVEPNEGVRLNEGLLKQLTGDDTVTARKLYSEEFEFKPEFKLWMATNHKPIIRGTDTGIWRRIHMIPFNVQIPEDKVDKNLTHKLKAEMTGIFKWCIDGCLMWQREGLQMPAAVLKSVREYRREMDVISAFIEDKCTLEGTVQASMLYAAYASWADSNNEYCMSNTKFSTELAKRFEKIKGRNYNYFTGISIRSEC
ncbi:phage/plasmid primase, P4 family [uncultured Ruminococcus sp.]|uniref:phage/plasmid primase, P4 family n=1 Tax=uncultured Ruminococcus sp. TaxID=165186 RepID=UPI00266FC2E8|nr:phage/plasmid primase, P4 family [uncultured Ruminococcus sp.]